MYYSHPHVSFQEVPDEVSLTLSISGCPLACKGCHSAFTWNPTYGSPLTDNVFQDYLKRYDGLITCVLFYGGEWNLNRLHNLLRQALDVGLKTCLFTGLEYSEITITTLNLLTYIKTGPYIQELGGLDSPHTNQVFQRGLHARQN